MDKTLEELEVELTKAKIERHKVNAKWTEARAEWDRAVTEWIEAKAEAKLDKANAEFNEACDTVHNLEAMILELKERRFRCGYCGQPIDYLGAVIALDVINKTNADWEKAGLGYGECCRSTRNRGSTG